MHFVFWQNILSPHQAPFLRALAGLGHEVTAVAAEPMTSDRLTLGWAVPDLGRVRVITSPDEPKIRSLIESNKEAIHIMAGARWTPLGNRALRLCRAARCRIGVMSEAPDPRGMLGYARWLKYCMERYTRGFCYDFILAMGEVGRRWFRCCGYPDRILFPFGYVTAAGRSAQTESSRGKPVLLFAGRLIPLKGLDLLFRAFASPLTKDAELRLLGDGPDKRRLEHLAQDLRIQDRVIWLPKRSPAGVQLEMEKADVTILPSRKDGWGAVVNESLAAGTPVICSTACGAADLIQQAWMGTIFRSGSVDDLRKALEHWIHLGPRSPGERERIRDWAKCISGPAVANYFVSIVEHVYFGCPRPVAPWRAAAPKVMPRLCTSV